MLSERIAYFVKLFAKLESTNSRTEKQEIVNEIPREYKEDFEMILDCVYRKHVFGYKFMFCRKQDIVDIETFTVKEVLDLLLMPMRSHNLSEANILYYCSFAQEHAHFFEQIVDGTLRLGVRPKVFSEEAQSPMLAKKFADVKSFANKYAITEKLDGNRSICYFDGFRWVSKSRNGKEQLVSFDTSELRKGIIYDGEIISATQSAKSDNLYLSVQGVPGFNELYKDLNVSESSTADFSVTSGIINSKSANKNLVYRIFDIVDDAPYIERRRFIDTVVNTDNVRVLPVLKYVDKDDVCEVATNMLYGVTSAGHEGIMLNDVAARYEHKRTSSLLKFKKFYTIDMMVVDIVPGRMKNEGFVGSLVCAAKAPDGGMIICNVGSGITDAQRVDWIINPTQIIHSIVEVGYFSLSQNANTQGTKEYSLRFPRLLKIREDKDETSYY